VGHFPSLSVSYSCVCFLEKEKRVKKENKRIEQKKKGNNKKGKG
jgi:hypothetical protein